MAYSRDKTGNTQDEFEGSYSTKEYTNTKKQKDTHTHTHTNKLWVFVKGSQEPIERGLNDQSQNNLSKK